MTEVLTKYLLQDNIEEFLKEYESRKNEEKVTQAMLELLQQEEISLDAVNINEYDNTGKTLLHYAIIGKQDISILDSLSNLIAQKDVYGMTPLMLAAKLNRLDWTEALAVQESLLVDKKGRTALMYAAYEGNYEIVSLLFPYEWYILDDSGRSCLSYFEEYNANYEELVKEYVRQYGCPQSLDCEVQYHGSYSSQLHEQLMQLKALNASKKERYLDRNEHSLEELRLEQEELQIKECEDELVNLQKKNSLLSIKNREIMKLQDENDTLQLQISALMQSRASDELELSQVGVEIPQSLPRQTESRLHTKELTAAEIKRQQMQEKIKQTLEEISDI